MTVEVVDGSDLLPPETPIAETIEQMAHVVAFGGDEYDNPIDRAILDEEAALESVFAKSAKLNLPDVKVPDAPKPRSRSKDYRIGKTSAAAKAPDQMVGLFAAGMITLISFSLGDDFLPTAQEAHDLSQPLANIIARRVDVAAKLGKDGNDTIAFAIAVMAYMVRVGPIATGKVRSALDDRQRRSRVDGVIPDERGNTDSETTRRVDARSDAKPSTNGRSPHNPVDAVAKATRTGLRVLERDLGPAANADPALGN